MLPLPFSNFIPAIFKRKASASRDALAAQVDSHVTVWAREADQIQFMRNAEQVPSGQALDELAYELAAPILPTDSDRIKRQKTQRAIKTNKNRSLWAEDVKPRIDAITGFSSSIFTLSSATDYNVPIFLGAPGDPPMGHVWSAFGGDGTINGRRFIGTGDELEIKGNIYIDLGTSTATGAQLDAIVADLDMSAIPAYFKVFFGYLTGSVFTVQRVIG